MTDGEGSAHLQYAESQHGQEQDEVLEEVKLAIPTSHRNNSLGCDVDPGGHRETEEDAQRTRRRGGGEDQWRCEVQEDQEPQVEVEVGPSLGVRITTPIRDPDSVSEEEEQQLYPALAPVAFFCLKQTSRPRNWCLRVVCNPYPFMSRAPGKTPTRRRDSHLLP